MGTKRKIDPSALEWELLIIGHEALPYSGQECTSLNQCYGIIEAVFRIAEAFGLASAEEFRAKIEDFEP